MPKHPRIHHLGFLDDRDKFDALAAADLLIMPSYFESLSMVALEAWALGRPVLANGHCDVLKGQCIRSNAGLYYESYEEFVEALYSLESNGPLNARLGRNGREFFKRNYAWPVIEQKYLDMFDQLKKDGLPPRPGCEPLPGFFARAGTLPRAAVLDAIPAGPVRATSVDADRRQAGARRIERPRSTRCSRRSATATPSATRCSASSACSQARATSRRSSSRPPTAGSST